MSPATWTAIRESFAEILDAPAGARLARLEALTPDVRAEVESLLEAYSTGGVVDRAPVRSGEALLERLGPYRLCEKIGEGGMGVIYRAERDDGEFQREVAIKVSTGRLLGSEAERRFFAERQILAQLEHPHIVRMLDGGTAADHRYLVMELVRGEPIHVAAARLAVPARLKLFRDVCSAVHYAHQNLVIHRDLKPANILVTAQGEVKVLDFGIAQLLGEAAEATQFHPMSLRCASPEQARGERLTLATDIYSLGLLLYELLTGQNPQASRDPQETRQTALQRILEDEPPPPSAVNPALTGDLDAITLKALAKEPARRFASADALAADVERYLVGEPVLARKPSRWYSFSQLINRNKAMAALAVALGLTLAAGGLMIAWQARVAERRFNEARRLISTVMHEVQPRLERVSGTLQMRKLLLESSVRYLEQIQPGRGDDPALAAEIIVAYVELARVTGTLTTANLGDTQAAGRLYQKALVLADAQIGLHPGDPRLLRAGAWAYGRAAYHEEDRGKKAMLARRGLDWAERLAEREPSDWKNRDLLAAAALTMGNLGGDERQQRKHLEQARALYTAEAALQPGNLQLLRNCALTHKYLAGLPAMAGNQRLWHAEQARDYDARILKQNPQDPRAQLDYAIDLSMISTAHEHLQDRGKALDFMRQSVAIREKVVAANPDDLRALDRLVYAQIQAGLRAGSEGKLELEKAIARGEILRQKGGLSNQSEFEIAVAWLELGRIEQGRAGCESFRRADRLFAAALIRYPEMRQSPRPREAQRAAAGCGGVQRGR